MTLPEVVEEESLQLYCCWELTAAAAGSAASSDPWGGEAKGCGCCWERCCCTEAAVSGQGGPADCGGGPLVEGDSERLDPPLPLVGVGVELAGGCCCCCCCCCTGSCQLDESRCCCWCCW